jgi:hypothetical protein
MDRSAVVVGGRTQVVQVQQDRLAAGQGQVARGIGREATELGSNAIPRSPRSPVELTVKGVSRKKSPCNRPPFWWTSIVPACSATNSLPSGASSIVVGRVRPVATATSAKPGGKVAGSQRGSRASDPRDANRRGRCLQGVGGTEMNSKGTVGRGMAQRPSGHEPSTASVLIVRRIRCKCSTGISQKCVDLVIRNLARLSGTRIGHASHARVQGKSAGVVSVPNRAITLVEVAAWSLADQPQPPRCASWDRRVSALVSSKSCTLAGG